MVGEITFRRARKDEAYQIACLMQIASEGLIEYLLSDIVRGATALELRSHFVEMGTSAFSYKRCLVAVSGTKVVGHANYFEPTKKERLTRYLMASIRLSARVKLWLRMRRIRAFEKLHYDDSLCIDTMAVMPTYRRRGIGNGLIRIVKQKARRRGLSYVSLRVWADNKAARSLYERHGFKVVESIDLSPRGPLAYKGRSLLMVSRA